MQPILVSLVAFSSTLLGGFLAMRLRDRLHLIVSFSAGVLIAVAIFDILPEIFSITTENRLSFTPALVAIIIGFLTIHIVEKVAVIHSVHEEEYATHKHPTIGMIGASGLALHSFLDGVGIGLGFHISPQIGFAVSLAVIAHDFCDGLNTVTLLLVNQNSRQKAWGFLLADAVAPILGVLSTYLFSLPQGALALYLGFYAGFLLYIGASDLLPEAHSQHSSFGMIGLTVLGVVLVFVVSRFT